MVNLILNIRRAACVALSKNAFYTIGLQSDFPMIQYLLLSEAFVVLSCILCVCFNTIGLTEVLYGTENHSI